MAIDYKILIDASGSMGFMNGTKEENKYLLPDGSSRTELVKKILNDSIIHILPSNSNIKVFSFRNSIKLNKDGTKKIILKEEKDKSGKTVFRKYYDDFPDLKLIVDKPPFKKVIDNIEAPLPGGTPLFWAISTLIHKVQSKSSIIILSDGGASDKLNFDEEVLRILKNKKDKEIVIHFIGIDQKEKEERRAQNLATKTGGVYINLKAIDYDKKELDILLSKLNSKIITKAIEYNLEKNKSFFINKGKDKSSEKNKRFNYSVESQVQRNTQSLGYISSQLTNILNILQSEKEIVINENKVYNEKVGRKAEEYIFGELKNLFKENRNITVTWVNEKEEQSFPYDFIVKDKGQTFYYECKGSSSDLNEFQLTKNEWNFYLDNRKKYRLCFVSNVESTPSYIRFMDLISDMIEKKIIPFSSKNREIKSNRIIFQVISK
ncbi:protein NO VEIN domain-containing protein [Tenacibaculum sp.]|uniref:protein NO VEIN domain-containing protein n=1 Tax=Tenacibaculum sp. TaxID=1906242 RepID=UPI003AA87B0E